MSPSNLQAAGGHLLDGDLLLTASEERILPFGLGDFKSSGYQ